MSKRPLQKHCSRQHRNREQEAAAKASQQAQEAQERREQEAAAKARQQAQEADKRREQEAAAKARQQAQEAQERREQEARAKAFQQAQEAQERREQEAAAKAVQHAQEAQERREQEARAKAVQQAQEAQERREQEARAKAVQQAQEAHQRLEQEAARDAFRQALEADADKLREQEAAQEAAKRSLQTKLKAIEQRAFQQELARLREEAAAHESMAATLVATPSPNSPLQRVPTEEWSEDAQQDPLSYMPRRELFPPTPIKGMPPPGHLLVTPEAPKLPPALPAIPKAPMVLLGSSAPHDGPRKVAKEPADRPPAAAAKKSMPAWHQVQEPAEQPSKSALDKRIRRALQPDSKGNYRVRQEILDQWANDRDGVFKLFASCGNDAEARLNYCHPRFALRCFNMFVDVGPIQGDFHQKVQRIS